MFMKSIKKAAMLSFGALMIAAPMVNAAVPESRDPIIIVQNNWTSQLVSSFIVEKVLESMGYTVEYKPSDPQLQFTAIANGDMHFQIEAWEGSMKSTFEKALTKGMVDAGTHAALTREEWWAPKYVADKCPGLPDWKALDKCVAIFATAETKPKGRFVGPPADWGKNYAERVKALKMNFVAINVGQAATLWAELQSAYDRKEPIVLFNWTPDYIESKLKGMFIGFPEPEGEGDKCAKDKSWSMNPDMVNDCGAPRSGWLKKSGLVRSCQEISCRLEIHAEY